MELGAQGSYAARRGETTSAFRFSAAFDGRATQAAVFAGAAAPLVDALLRRNESALLFAYGNTNAGKTHTITGPPSDPGVVPRTLTRVFQSIAAVEAFRGFAAAGEARDRAALARFVAREYDDAATDVVPLDPAYRYCVWLSYIEI